MSFLLVLCDLEAVPIWAAAMYWSFHTGLPAWLYPLSQGGSL